jgi:hypothetical protein
MLPLLLLYWMCPAREITGDSTAAAETETTGAAAAAIMIET